jgi:hypothetical protein
MGKQDGINPMNDSALQVGPDELALVECETVKPIPPRYWWLKRLSFAGVVFMVLLVGLRMYWGHEADRRLNRTMEDFREVGQPASVDEINAQLDGVADEDNAALLLENAISQIVFAASSGLGIDSFVDDPLIFFYDAADAEELVAKNTIVLDLVHQARFKPKVAWSARLPGNAPGVPQRNIAKILWIAGTQQRLTHDYQAMIRTIHDGVEFSDSVAEHPRLISSLVAWACENLILTLVEDLDSSLSIESVSMTQVWDQPAMRADAVALIEALLDERRLRSAVVNAFYGDGLGNIKYIEELDRVGASTVLGSNPILDIPFKVLCQPFQVLDVEVIICLQKCAAIGAAQPDWPKGRARLPVERDGYSVLTSITRPLSISGFGNWRNTYAASIRQLFKTFATRRMAAIALAIRLYQHDHGTRPVTLDALVPAYLGEVPRDPFDGDGGAIRIGRHSGLTVLYSVGEDGVDDGGQEVRGVQSDAAPRKGDIVFALDGSEKWRTARRSLGLGQTGEDDDHE